MPDEVPRLAEGGEKGLNLGERGDGWFPPLKTRSTTILHSLFKHALEKPNEPLMHWLNQEGRVAVEYTRGELWTRASIVAERLKKVGVREGQRVMIVFPFGIEFVVGMVALWRLGATVVSVYPPNPAKLQQDVKKLRQFQEDCGASVALTTAKYKLLVGATGLKVTWPKLDWIAVDGGMPKNVRDLPIQTTDSWTTAPPDATALIQYTSGSISFPKGVELTFGNIAHQMDYMRHLAHAALKIPAEECVGVHFVPQYHDFGLIASYLLTLDFGSKGYFLSPLDFIQNPPLWFRCVSRYGATYTNGPSFAFGLSIKRLEAKGECLQCPRLGFCSLGGEPSDFEMLPKMQSVLGISPNAVYNCWGQAETGVMATTFGTNSCHQGKWSVGSVAFASAMGVEVKVVDIQTMQDVPDGSEGEVWIKSESVGKGYLNKPEKSAETFNAVLKASFAKDTTGGKGGKGVEASGPKGELDEKEQERELEEVVEDLCQTSQSLKPEEMRKVTFETKKMNGESTGWLRSGDIGVVSSGELFILSRLKDLIIVAGKNFAPVDLERAAEQAFPDDIRPGSTVAFQSSEGSVVLVCEVREGVDLSGLQLLSSRVRARVEGEIGLELEVAALVRKGAVPKTTSGKVRRAETKRMWEAGELTALAGSERTELDGATSLEALFKAAGVSDWDETLAANGIDSLKLTQLVQTAQEKFGVTVSFAEASEKSAGDLLKDLTAANSRKEIVRVPVERLLSKEEGEGAERTRKRSTCTEIFCRLLIQTVVIMYVTACVIGSSLPSAYFVQELWEDTNWWNINGRAGPLIVASLVLYGFTFSAVVILSKWVLLGRWRPKGPVRRWSFQFARWWTVQRLAAVWETSAGSYVLDTPLASLFYILLGARVSMSARIESFLRDWDFVSVGPRAHVKGLLLARVFCGRSLFFGPVKIERGASVGGGGIVYPWSVVGKDVEVAAGSVVLVGDRLEEGPGSRYEGVPAKLVKDGEGGRARSGWEVVEDWYRLLLVFAFATQSAAFSALWAWVIPESPLEGRLETWTEKSIEIIATQLAVFLLVGLSNAACVILLKWTFLAPLAVDLYGRWTWNLWFRIFPRTALCLSWHRALGLRVHPTATALLIPESVAPSKAHLVSVGQHSFMSSPLFVPEWPQGVAKSVWTWIGSLFTRDKLLPPWWSVMKPTIEVPGGMEVGLRTRWEEGAVANEGALGTSPGTRIRKGDVLQRGRVGMGNPLKIQLGTGKASLKNRKSTVLISPGIAPIRRETQSRLSMFSSQLIRAVSNKTSTPRGPNIDFEDPDDALEEAFFNRRRNSFMSDDAEVPGSATGRQPGHSGSAPAGARLRGGDIEAPSPAGAQGDGLLSSLPHAQSTASKRLVYALHLLLQLCHAVFWCGTLLVAGETVRDAPLYEDGWDTVERVPVAFAIVLSILFGAAVVQTFAFHWVFIGVKRSETEFPQGSARSVLLQHMQEVFGVMRIALIPIMQGTWVHNALLKALGHRLDLDTVLICDGAHLDPNDGGLVELGRWAVLDLGSKAESHIVSGGNAEFRVLRVGGEAVLHPLSMLCQGAIGERAHLLPNSRPLKGLALPAASVSVGNPSLQGVRKEFESVSGPLDAV
uniref:Carrier domain-containing protein n=1 Tax=Chromera velia CCMP2878 TaxID=1169474 RepID=A0A0G4F6Y5_9ALVE|eukprot:Cvel_15395.t1-p1 / transcript=Cvel_15395.t1 / gene=Cvel_15395 / organism=Chromera_velia_CCMP2878 / gene_product=Long-chain-fatty-acid--AMP ligase FadD28, putative / transcript_product=Long-chain-fatty-acid--AMP ligase FadD28, putative / location=Cvel_scaffold1136:45739-51153(-) / protein_length=1605 / sequence_SO=supercontig / SO=protein_coding / is_pseudo=false